MKALIITFSILVYFSSYAQTSFEGEIIYQNYDEEMKPTDKTIYKVKGDKVTQYIHNEKKNSISLIQDSTFYYLYGDEFKKVRLNNKNNKNASQIIKQVNFYDSISKIVFHINTIKNDTPTFIGRSTVMKMLRYMALDSTVKVNLQENFELPLHNKFGYLIKARKNITKSEYFNKTTYSIFQSMTAKPIEDSEFEPE
jgi:hypothetical protein